MKNVIKKAVFVSFSSVFVFMFSGCTFSLTQGIDENGMAEKVVFPELGDAWVVEEVYPKLESLSKIRPGVSKDDLYYLIGYPHFSAAHGAYEWDYIFRFAQPDGSVKTCQYKVLFDKDWLGQSFYWLPASCEALANPKPLYQETFEIGMDVLFKFDRFSRNDILDQGMADLNELATKIKAYMPKGRLSLIVKGHADRLGDDGYNYQLSHRRATTIKQVLVQDSIPASLIEVYGVGEAAPVVQCNNQNQSALISCLQPNRRVTVQLKVYPK